MVEVSVWHQTVTLVKRNVLLKYRRKSQTIQEVLFPMYFIGILILLKLLAFKPQNYPAISLDDTATTYIFPFVNVSFSGQLYVAPNFSEAVNLIENINLTTQSLKYTMFNSLDEMDSSYKSAENRNAIIGIYFPSSSIYDYAIRYGYNTLSSSDFDYVPGNCRATGNGTDRVRCPANNYLYNGFAALQILIDSTIARMNNATFPITNVSVQMMPKDPGVSNTDAFGIITPIYFVLAYSPLLTFLLVNIVHEKEKKIKEGMKMMGLSDLAFWFSWSMVYTVLVLVLSIVGTIMSVFGQLFPHSNFFLIFLCTFLYGISLIMMAYLITPFFSKAKTAATVGSFITMMMSLIFLAITYSTFSNAGIAAVSLLSPTAFAFVISKVVQFEVQGVGAQFSNIAEDPNPLYIGLVMIVVDIVLYFLLTLYLDRVIPSEYGKKDSPIFCLKPSFWCKSKKKPQLGRSTSIKSGNSHSTYEPTQYNEPVPQELIGQEAIRLQNLTKIYRKDVMCSDSVEETIAVKNFSLDIYKGQITALLGHNGAGKTTIFNILTGFVSSTYGTAHVYDYDISDPHDLDDIRKMTGVCPQHDILHDVLSVKDHLEVFAGIKGIKGDEKDAEVERVLNAIGLMDQKETFAEKLSGGQKRKLSIGIAIMGDPKILILDEPTAGVDPYSRRKMWNLLRSGQEDRVTLLTTHFMDEADILADRKAIIGKGRLKCVGSSLFLKNRFGVGYHLGLVTKTHVEHQKITDCVVRHVEDAKLQRSVGMELTYTLPLSQVSNFANLFSSLDNEQNELGLQSYGVSMTTLEEVFLKIGDEDEEEESEEQIDSNGLIGKENVSFGYDNPSSPAEHDGSVTIQVNQNKPMFDPAKCEVTSERNNLAMTWALMKRSLYIIFRSPGYVIFSIIFPLGLVIGGVAVLSTASTADPNSGNPLAVNVFAEAYTHKNILYRNSTGQDLTNFVTNIPSGLTASENNFDNLLNPGFYPHYIGLDVMEFSSSAASYKALYNTSAVTSIPAAINTFSNTMLSFLTSGTRNITTSNKPWPLIDQQATFNGSIFGGVLMSALAIVMTSALTILFSVKEREDKIRPQLRVSGVTFFHYWLSLLAVDYSLYFLVSTAFVICLAAFKVSFYYTGGAILALVILLVGWGFSSIFTSYCCNFLFSKMDSAGAAWPLIVQLASMLPFITVSTLDMLDSSDAALWLNVLFVIFIPYYVGFSGLYYISKVYITALLRGQQNNIPISAYFDWSEPMIPFAILITYLQTIFLFFLLMVLDVKKNGGVFPLSFCTKKKSDVSDSTCDLNQDNIDGEDDDVETERKKVDQIMNNKLLTEESPIVLMQGLRKEYEKRTGKCCAGCRDLDEDEADIKVAVRNLSLSVYSGEVLGLLGPNGAGKTTALNVLIADTAPTKGKISMAGKPVFNTMSDAFKDTGYCPQSNPVWESITLREHLEIYATLRGLKKESIPSTIDNFIEALGITEHAHKRAKTLSGGTKRKLCFAISMLANPKVVLLDEPSTGMDPKTKRFMWDTISTAFQGSDRGAILTTHYMEEADALCSRVGIMVLGHLKCVGSTQHLKNKFGRGYILEIKLENQEADDDTNSSNLSSFVKELFPNVEPAEKFGNRSVFKIPRQDVTSLANVFSTLEGAKSDLGIEEYSFSQSTLEQVFLKFAKEQAEKDEEQQERIQERARLRKKQKKSCC